MQFSGLVLELQYCLAKIILSRAITKKNLKNGLDVGVGLLHRLICELACAFQKVWMIFVAGFSPVQDLKQIKRNAQGGHWSSSNNINGLDNTKQSGMRTLLKTKKPKKM